MKAGAVTPVKPPKLYVAIAGENNLKPLETLADVLQDSDIKVNVLGRSSSNPYLAKDHKENKTGWNLGTSIYVSGLNSDGAISGPSRIIPFLAPKGTRLKTRPVSTEVKPTSGEFTVSNMNGLVDMILRALKDSGFKVGPVTKIQTRKTGETFPNGTEGRKAYFVKA